MIIDAGITIRDLDVILLEEIDSTNTYAKRNTFEKDTLIVTDFQTGGRGRYQRPFYSPKSKGLYFSLALHNLDLSAQIFTIIMAVAISEEIPGSSIKWLNDVYIDDKKVCGILCEGVIVGKKYSKVIVGAGINLFETEVPSELEKVMTWVGNDNLKVNDFLSSIINRFYELLETNREIVIDYYKQRCNTIGKWIKVDGEDYFAIDIDLQGHLVCIDKNEKQITFNNAEVSLHAK